MKILIAITGASGIPIAIEFMKVLRNKNIETHLILSQTAKTVLNYESEVKREDLHNLVTTNYECEDFTAPPASGSYLYDAMVIIPCTMKTLAAIANGYADNLISRAADVSIKENRKLILVVRESPLSAIHLENMLKLARLGVIISPPIPSFYIKPQSIHELIYHTIGRILDQLGISIDIKRWGS